MPSLAVCRCLFRLMRRCFLGRWICLPVSERFRQVWKCHLFHYSTCIQFCVHWHGGQCLWRLVLNYAVVFRLGWVYSLVCIPLGDNAVGKNMNPSFLPHILVNSRTDWFFNFGTSTSLTARKFWIQTSFTSPKNWLCVVSCQWKKGLVITYETISSI